MEGIILWFLLHFYAIQAISNIEVLISKVPFLLNAFTVMLPYTVTDSNVTCHVCHYIIILILLYIVTVLSIIIMVAIYT